jgi:ParB-like chromosome segregation protein Spo0J
VRADGAILARMDVDLDALTGIALADPPRHLDEEVARYAQILDQLPPVVVFNLGDGLLLVDGYHRVEAARRLGWTVVQAEVQQGSREDALRFAVDLAASERGLTKDQALDAIRSKSGKRWGAA